MTIGGWITFILSITLVTSLFAWCIWKVLSYKNPNKMQGSDLFDEEEIANPPKRTAKR